MPSPLAIDKARLDKLPAAKRDRAIKAIRDLEDALKHNPLLRYNNPALGPVHPKQLAFHSFETRRKAFIGGNQSGKTTSGIVDDIIQGIDRDMVPPHLQKYKRYSPPFRCRIAAQGREEIEDFVFEKMREWLPPSQLVGDKWKTAYDKQHHVLHLKNGTYYQFKCFRPDQRALMPDGTWKPVGELKPGDKVQTRYGPKAVTEMTWYEDAPMIRLRGRWGYEIVSTPNHPHLVEGEWKEASDIQIGDRLDTMESEPTVGASRPLWELGWLAILIGDGCLRANHVQFSAAVDSPMIDDLPYLPTGSWLRKQEGQGDRCDTWFLSTDEHKANRFKELLKAEGLWGLGSHDKFIPPSVFTEPEEKRRYFLRYLWGCDGTINEKARSATYVTVSRRLAFDVKYLLRGLGYFPTIVRSPRSNGTAYLVNLTGQEAVQFVNEIGKAGLNPQMRESEKPQGKRYKPGEVFAIEELEPGRVCCPTIEGVNELVVDGIVTHNTYQQEAQQWGGSTLDRVHMDEEPGSVHLQEARIRVMRREGDLLFTMTPVEGLTHMYDEFDEAMSAASENGGLVEQDGLGLVVVHMDDNPWLTEDAKKEALRGLSREERIAREEGKFVALSGLIYPDFKKESHLIDPIHDLPENCNVIVSIDPGIRHACAVAWFYLTPDDKMVMFQEGYYKDMTIEQVCKEIHHTNAHYGCEPIYYVIDPAARNRNSQTGRSDQSEFADHGIVTIPGQNSVTAGINRVKERFQNDRLFISSECENFLKEIRAYRWKKPPRRGEDEGKPVPVKSKDHLMDATRLAVMSRPYLPEEYNPVNETSVERMAREHLEAVTKPYAPIG